MLDVLVLLGTDMQDREDAVLEEARRGTLSGRERKGEYRSIR